jgi:hypothetical protein
MPTDFAMTSSNSNQQETKHLPPTAQKSLSTSERPTTPTRPRRVTRRTVFKGGGPSYKNEISGFLTIVPIRQNGANVTCTNEIWQTVEGRLEDDKRIACWNPNADILEEGDPIEWHNDTKWKRYNSPDEIRVYEELHIREGGSFLRKTLKGLNSKESKPSSRQLARL